MVACGLKAAPQPRERVVPAPVKELSLKLVPEGVRVVFKLPSQSLDGSPLQGIGGYRLFREGPEGKTVRDDVTFSISERRERVGKSVVFVDEPPPEPGTYTYYVQPRDNYGSHPGRGAAVEFFWPGQSSWEAEE